MSATSPHYQSRIAELNSKISDSRQKLTERQITLISNSARQSSYLTPIKNYLSPTSTNLNTSLNTSSSDKKLEKQAKEASEKSQNELKQFLGTSQNLRDFLEEKARFIEIEHQKQAHKWQQDNQKLSKEIQHLNQKIQQKDLKIEGLIQTVAFLKAEKKDKAFSPDNHQKIIKELKSDNDRLKAENTEVKQNNKILKADNKIITSHLDKLLKAKEKDEKIEAKNAFEEQQKRVIQALYNKSMPAMDYPEKPEMLPSQRNQLSNKVKLEQLLEEYKGYRRQASMQIRKLTQENECKSKKIQVQDSRIQRLEEKVKSLEDLRLLDKSNHNQRLLVMNKMEQQIADLNTYNENLIKHIEGEEISKSRIKEKIGTISKSKKQRFFGSRG